MLAGLLVTLPAQRAIGESWRIGVDPDERTELVTAGLFGRLRTPIFTGMLLLPPAAPSPSRPRLP
jgi:protein-S-isoprenylcysteine O-methyltransferase Ste14